MLMQLTRRSWRLPPLDLSPDQASRSPLHAQAARGYSRQLAATTVTQACKQSPVGLPIPNMPSSTQTVLPQVLPPTTARLRDRSPEADYSRLTGWPVSLPRLLTPIAQAEARLLTLHPDANVSNTTKEVSSNAPTTEQALYH